MKYRIGLDVGANSLGWSIVELDETGKQPVKLVDAGARIFTDGRDEKSKATLKADRRIARSARRRRDRYRQRRTYLLEELVELGLFPDDETSSDKARRAALQKKDPLHLRSDALERRLCLFDIGRVLFHLNQRRGFKSNRKDAESRDGVVKASVKLLQQKLEEAEAPTLGAFLWKRRKRRLPTRTRRHGKKKSDLYEFYPTRALLEQEFCAIWKAQKDYHPKVLTNEARQRLHKVIFTQRPLKPVILGKCVYLTDRDRTYRAMPTFQRYRIYQEINNLEWATSTGRRRLRDYPEARDRLIEMAERPTTKKGNVTFGKMKKELQGMGIAEGDFQFNLETAKRKGLDGNLTSNLMQREGLVGPDWHAWPLEKQDAFIAVILDDEASDEEVREKLVQEYGLTEVAAAACTEAPLLDGTAQLSLEAARLLLAKMRDDSCIQSDAVQAVAREHQKFRNPFTRAGDGALLDKLPYYGEVVRGHIIPGKGDEEHFQNRVGMVTNPTVHIAMNQIRHVVNEIIGSYGRPYSIAIELGRELPVGAEGRKELDRQQAENQKTNARLDGLLREHKQPPNHDNRLRLRLWEELAPNPLERFCPFSGRRICITDLFNGQNIQIDHLIPFSISLDDSPANKVVCTAQANQDKGKQTPFQAFGNSPEGYDWNEIFERSRLLPKNKQWRFQENALEIWKRDHDDFLSRHLNDTRYIGRLTREYLENVCPRNRIDVLTGRLTALLRGHWGLNRVLSDDRDRKNRDDHRHHAVDAIVTAMTTRAMLQRISTAAGRAEELNVERLFDGKKAIDPWPSFREDVKALIRDTTVSHKPRRQKQGQLHNDNTYGVVSRPNSKRLSTVVIRKPIDEFIKGSKPEVIRSRLKTIRDDHLREEILESFDKEGKEGVQKLAEQKNIRRLRSTENLRIIPIENAQGERYKAYKPDSNWAAEIYAYPSGHEKAGKWEGVVISRFEANQKEFQPGQTRKPHPAAKLVMRLHINDYIEIDEDERRRLKRIQKMSEKGDLSLVDPEQANVDKRNRDQADPFKYLSKSLGQLQNLDARKVHLSPTGKKSYGK